MANFGGLLDEETLAQLQAFQQPSQEAQEAARRNALMQAGFSMMANNRGLSRGQAFGNALGHGGMAGMDAYQGTMDAAQKNQMNQLTQGMQLSKLMEDQRAKKQRQEQLTMLRNGLPEKDRALFDVAPDEYIKNMPIFQKPQLVEIADSNEPLRTKKVWMRPGETDGTVAGLGSMPEILDPRVQAAKQKIAAAGRSVQSTNVFNNTKDDFKNERDLRNDFAGLPTTKAFKEVQSAYDQINVAIKKESPAGDLAAATKIMKILDPGSVVRESELGMAMQATGAMDRVANYADMVINGTKLTPSQRKDFGELSAQLYGVASDRYNSSVSEYQGVAKDYNLNPDRVAKRVSSVSAGGWSAQKVGK